MSRPQFRDAAELLRDRDFAKLFAAHMVAWFGTSMAPIAMAFGVLHVTGSARDTGVVVACQTAAQIVVLLFGGVVADRMSRRRVMVSADLLAMSSQATMAIAFVTEHAHVPLMMALMVCNGVALAFHQPALMGFIPQVVKPEKLQSANALLGTARSGAFALGAACAGVSVALFSSRPTIPDAGSSRFQHRKAVLMSGSALKPATGARTTVMNDVEIELEQVHLRVGWLSGNRLHYAHRPRRQRAGLMRPMVAKRWMGVHQLACISTAFGIGTYMRWLRRDAVERPATDAENSVCAYSRSRHPRLLLATTAKVWSSHSALRSRGCAVRISACCG